MTAKRLEALFDEQPFSLELRLLGLSGLPPDRKALFDAVSGREGFKPHRWNLDERRSYQHLFDAIPNALRAEVR